jgi:sodium-dependent dicarboxylate transporter 2/3/5
VSAASGADPLQLAIPVTMATSYAFMHPVATPPNTIVYGSGAVTMREMARAGLILNVLGILAITLLSRFYFPWLAR